MSQVSKSIIVHATPKACFEIVSDYEAYPEFLKETKEVTLGKRSGHTVDVTYSLELIKKISYTLRTVEKAPKEISWTLVKGDLMKSNTGRWILKDLKDGTTELTYEIDLELGLFVPSAISKMLVGSHLPALLEAMKKRIESLQKKKKK